MSSSRPNFSPFPYERLVRVRRADAAIESAIARWIAARPLGARVARLAGGPVSVRLVGVTRRAAFDPHPVLAELRIAGVSIVVAASARPVRAIARRLVGGPEELDAPRPCSPVESAIWALVLAAVIADWNAATIDVWPLAEPPRDGDRIAIELAVEIAGQAMTVMALCPRSLDVRVPPPRPLPGWVFDVPIVAARCALPRAAVHALAPRDVIVVERELALVVGRGTIGLRAAPGAIEAMVATGYVRRDMALPDDAHLELTVQLGTTQLSLRQLGELAVGQVIALGRPLAGPYEIRAAGRLVGEGELVDVDGELGVRIVALSAD